MKNKAGYGGSESEMLVFRARKGDQEAFERLYRMHANRIFALCLRLSGKRAAAEELTQDVFVRAWEKLHLFEGKSAFTSWLHRLAVNVVIGSWRAKKRRGEPLAWDEARPPREERNPEGGPAAAMDLEQAIAALPQGARTVFVLHDVEGFSHDEIAFLTGIAPGTSKAQLHWARKHLREALKT
jgi:RNA polymerase sigma-70 factor (ECF subfamily)